jgi:carbamoylphosphate synthase large subunit
VVEVVTDVVVEGLEELIEDVVCDSKTDCVVKVDAAGLEEIDGCVIEVVEVASVVNSSLWMSNN